MAGKGVNVANAYVQIIPSAQGVKQNITDALVPDLTAAGQQGGDALGGGLMSTLQGSLGKIAGVIGAAFAGIEVGRFLLDVGAEFDDMTDAIIIGTGASGEALEALEESAKNIATTVPVSFGEAGNIVQDLNTRLGLTGENLEDVGQRVAAAGELMGQAINVESLSGAFAAFDVQADDMASQMDYLFGVSQSTGIAFDDLTGILERNAPALQGLGFSFEESANMAGLLDRAGMDASGMMGKMSKALVSLAQPGETAAEAYQRVLTEMEGYIEAGDEAAAMDLATDLFGTRGAAQFVGAVQSGALAMDDLRDASLGAGDGIMGTYEATADWPEKWELLKNKAMEFLEPLGGALMDSLGAALDKLNEIVDGLDPTMLQGIADAIGTGLGGAVEFLGGAVEVLASHSDDIATFFGYVATGAQTVMDVIEPLASFLSDTFSGTVVPLLESALDILGGDFEGAAANIRTAFDNMKTTIMSRVEAIRSFIGPKFQAIKTAITTPIENARNAIKSAIDRIKGIFNTTLSFPHIKLPHFRINGGEIPWGIGGKGKAPSIGIDWYAKGGFVDGATLIGVGEQGAEMVWPSYEPYLTKYASAIAESMPGNGPLVDEVKALRSDVRNLKVYLDTGALVGGISRQMDGSLGRRQLMAGRGVV